MLRSNGRKIISRDKAKQLRETCSSVTLSTTNQLGFNLCFHKTGCSRLSYSTIQTAYKNRLIFLRACFKMFPFTKIRQYKQDSLPIISKSKCDRKATFITQCPQEIQTYSHSKNVRSLETTRHVVFAAVCKRSITQLFSDQWLHYQFLTLSNPEISLSDFQTVYIISCFIFT